MTRTFISHLKKLATSIKGTPFSAGKRSGRLTPSGRAFAGAVKDKVDARRAAMETCFNDLNKSILLLSPRDDCKQTVLLCEDRVFKEKAYEAGPNNKTKRARS